MGPGGAVDEILAVCGGSWMELQSHGGVGVQLALEEFLLREGWLPHQKTTSPPRPLSLRGARAQASELWGDSARLHRLAEGVLAGNGPKNPKEAYSLALRLGQALAHQGHGARLARPALVRLVGRPNAGKSTLFNAMLGDRRALVSPQPGTTRDTVRAEMSLEGVPIILEDTAGSDCELTRESCFQNPAPDLVVQLLSDPQEGQLSGPGTLLVLGRADLQSAGTLPRVSGRTGAGLELLLRAMAHGLGVRDRKTADVLAPLNPNRVAAMELAADQLLS